MNVPAGLIMIFMSGFVAALNMEELIPHPAGYEATWWKVAFCVGIAITAGLILSLKKYEN